jgi:acetyl-CoA carboxylase biotin carboxyl carrier protein
MKMDLNYIKKLIKIIDTSNIAEIEIEEEGSKLKLSKPRPKIAPNLSPVNFTPIQNNNPAETLSLEKAISTAKLEAARIETHGENVYEVKSPMVGTFYRAPSPDADSYVNVGSNVSPGSVLCIIEAMKLMNEIECEVSGKIIKILVENTQPVEYNQPLFLIEKN